MLSNKDRQWMQLCIAGAQIFSTCAKRQYFSFIINPQNIVVGQGYNGVPTGMVHCADGGCPRFANNVPSGTPYDSGPGLCYSGHAEQNALARANALELHHSTLYVNGLPCLTCAKQMASAGIRRVVFLSEEGRLDWTTTKKFLLDLGIQVYLIDDQSAGSS